MPLPDACAYSRGMKVKQGVLILDLVGVDNEHSSQVVGVVSVAPSSVDFEGGVFI